MNMSTLRNLALCLSPMIVAFAATPAISDEGPQSPEFQQLLVRFASDDSAPRQGPPFGRGRGQRSDPRFAADHEGFFFLLDNRQAITRQVTKRDDGIETVTESRDPEVAVQLREHVAAMYDRVEKVNPIHMRDPLFREVFRHAKQIKMEMHDTAKGVRVVETSDDPYVAELIKAHADVVSLFIKNGRDELRKNHPLPPRPRR